MHVLIVDSCPTFRAGLKALLDELDPNIETGEATSVAEAADLYNKGEAFDLVLLDIDLLKGNGVEALHRVKEVFDEAHVIVLSPIEDRNLIRSAIDIGGWWLYSKNEPR
jgi:DNA-binding NarL/FixJ family response regulator